ncbi:MAG: deoxyribonuclease IV [Coriobacteriales bacterium]
MPALGCHLSVAKGYLSAAETAVGIGADTFQFFTRNPRGGSARPVDSDDLAAFSAYAREHGIARVVAHAPYTLNPCSDKERVRTFAHTCLQEDLARMELMPHQLYNFHPGSHVGQGSARGVELVAQALDEVLAPEQTTLVLLETMSGKGSEVGGTFEELRAVIDRVELADHVGVCLDTCHVWDAGYDVAGDLDGVLDAFDRVIGLERLRAVHLNDSKNPRGSHKDRHERIGQGAIGFDALARVFTHPALAGVPFVLETPNELPGYAEEISSLRRVAGEVRG